MYTVSRNKPACLKAIFPVILLCLPVFLMAMLFLAGCEEPIPTMIDTYVPGKVEVSDSKGSIFDLSNREYEDRGVLRHMYASLGITFWIGR